MCRPPFVSPGQAGRGVSAEHSVEDAPESGQLPKTTPQTGASLSWLDVGEEAKQQQFRRHAILGGIGKSQALSIRNRRVGDAVKEHQAGAAAPELCRKHGISEATFYAWRSKYGGMEVSDARCRNLHFI